MKVVVLLKPVAGLFEFDVLAAVAWSSTFLIVLQNMRK